MPMIGMAVVHGLDPPLFLPFGSFGGVLRLTRGGFTKKIYISLVVLCGILALPMSLQCSLWTIIQRSYFLGAHVIATHDLRN